MQGYDALRSMAAWRDLSSRGRILARGEDNARLLHAMSSNNVNALADGEGCYAFFLNAQGRIQADAYILKCGEDFLIETEASAHAALFEHLDKFIIADDVTLESLHDSHFAIGIEGPEALALAASFGYPIPAVPGGIAKLENGYIARLNETGLDGVRIILPLADKEATLAWLASTPLADEDAWETVRLEQGKPRFGLEIEAKNLVQETRLLHAVHFSKGCYLGQEIVERVRARGAVHKGIASVSLETKTLPPPEAEFCGGGDQAGRLLNARYSPAEDRCVGFAMLGVGYLDGTKPMTCNGLKATVRPSSAFAAKP
jgi:tRNA-modifying protein YgfZ